MLEKITPENDIKLSDKQWDAIEELIAALGVQKDFEVSTVRGERCVFDREEDRPLFTPFAIEHLAKLVDKPLTDYGLDAEAVSTLEVVFALVKKG